MLTEAISRAARDFGDRAAFVLPTGRGLGFADLERASREVAAGLRARGVGEGCVVALVLPSGFDYAAVYLGAARVGAITAGINPVLTASETAGCLETLRADLVITDTGLAPSATAGGAGRVEVLDAAHDPAEAGGSLRVDAPSADAPAAPADDDRPVCVCFTSGTTGAPRGAWFTDRQLQAVSELDTGTAWGGHGIATTHFAHVGFMTKLPWMLARGRTTHLLGRWSAGPALELIARHRMTAVAGVAPQIALMVRHPAARTLDFSAVRAVVAGGAASTPDLVRAARACFGAPYSIRYSSTESGGVGLETALDADDEEACHSVGRPRPGVDARIRTPDGRPVATGEVGELWLRSEAVMSGYWRDPSETASALVDGWLRTGDLASVDARGLFRLAGRTTDMYIRGGYNVHPMEVEGVLSEHPDVREVAVVGRPDPVMGEVGLAVVAPRDPANAPTLEDLRTFAARSLAGHKLPEALEIVDALPRNATDKIDRRRLR